MLKWPNADNPTFTLDVEIDDRTIEQYPFETTDEVIVGARAHVMAAQDALNTDDDSLQHSTEYYIATAAVAFWHACQAKQCLNYARSHYEEGQIPTIAADLLRQADLLITKALERTAGDLPDALDIDPVPKALVSARARLNTVQDLTEKLHVLHPMEDPHPQRALTRMIAYMGAFDHEVYPAVVYDAHCQEAIIRLHEAANAVVQQNNHLLKLHVDDGMQPFDQILPALIDMPIGVNSTHLGMFSPGPDQDQLPDTTEIFVSYIFHGIKYIQCATDPYPQGFPKDLAREHVTSIKERINAFEYHEADIHRFWDIVNNLEAAISVGLHDLSHFYLDVILDDLRAELDVPDGFIHHIVLALALGNIHAARFLSKWYAGPSNTAPTPLQATTILEAAKRTRMDPHQIQPSPFPSTSTP